MNNKTQTIAITGGSGFVGRAITHQLQTQHDIIWLSSRSPTLSDEFNQVTVKSVDYSNINSIAAAIDGCDAVIHLIGILHETRTASFDDIHHQLPQRLVKACAQAHVGQYLHMSALGVAADGPSQYLKSKFLGEQAAFALAKRYDIRMLSFRPSIIFGREDNFFNQFAKLLRYTPIFPVPCPEAEFQPVSVNDVAKAFVWGLNKTATGKTYELAGQEVMTMMQVLQRVCQFHGYRRWLIPLPDMISRLQAQALNSLPNAPMTLDNYLSLQKPNTSARWDWAHMNIQPEPVSLTTI